MSMSACEWIDVYKLVVCWNKDEGWKFYISGALVAKDRPKDEKDSLWEPAECFHLYENPTWRIYVEKAQDIGKAKRRLLEYVGRRHLQVLGDFNRWALTDPKPEED